MPELFLKISPYFLKKQGDSMVLSPHKLISSYSLQIVLSSGEQLMDIPEDLIAKA